MESGVIIRWHLQLPLLSHPNQHPSLFPNYSDPKEQSPLFPSRLGFSVDALGPI